ncbi:MAG: hypothetical protein ACAH83_11840 [Alphaproteobacteria bacterium]
MSRPLLLAVSLSILAWPLSAEAIVMRTPHEPVACTMDAKICPDGSGVSRTGPNCEFAPCPGEPGYVPPQPPKPVPPNEGPDGSGGGVGGGSAPGSPPQSSPGHPGQSGSYDGDTGVTEPGVISSPASPGLPDAPVSGPQTGLPDEPLLPPSQVQSVKFVMEHRTALDGQRVTVHGVITYALPPGKACPPGQGACAQPRIIIADKDDAARNKAYDLTILLPEDDQTAFAEGQIVDISGTVSGSADGVTVMKE